MQKNKESVVAWLSKNKKSFYDVSGRFNCNQAYDDLVERLDYVPPAEESDDWLWSAVLLVNHESR